MNHWLTFPSVNNFSSSGITLALPQRLMKTDGLSNPNEGTWRKSPLYHFPFRGIENNQTNKIWPRFQGVFVPLVVKQGIQVCVRGVSTVLQATQTCLNDSRVFVKLPTVHDLIKITLFPTVSIETCVKWKRETRVSAPSAAAPTHPDALQAAHHGLESNRSVGGVCMRMFNHLWRESQPSFYCLSRRTSSLLNVGAAVDARYENNEKKIHNNVARCDNLEAKSPSCVSTKC